MALDAVPTRFPDVSDPALYQNDTFMPVFEEMRAAGPVHFHPESPYGPYWSMVRFKEIMEVEVDHRTYSSEIGGIQLLDQPEDMKTPSFIRMDPPEHTGHRKTVAPMFAPSIMAEMEADIRRRTAEVLDGLPRGEAFDWVDRVSIELTTAMLAVLFDFPWEDRRKLTYWSDVAITNYDAPDALVRSRAEQLEELGKMAEYVGRLWKERAAAPPKRDLISMMAHSPATRDLSPKGFIGTFSLLIVGGNDTTRNSMTAGLMAVNDNPEVYEAIKRDRSLIQKKLVPEIVRWATPVIHMRRTTTQETELAGHTIPAGAKVIMWYASGNFDDDAMAEPTRFTLERERPRRHLSFGAGVHRCVGDRLADLQLKVLWEELAAQDLDIEILGPAERTYSNFIRGIAKLPVRING